MKRRVTIFLALTSAALLLIFGCLAPRPGGSGIERSEDPSAVTVSVENSNWSDASTYIYCNGTQVGTVRGLVTGQRGTMSFSAESCSAMAFMVRLLGPKRNYISPPISVAPGQCYDIEIGNRLAHTRWSHCGEA